MKKFTQKITALTLSILLMMGGSGTVLAFEIPSAPTPPPAPTVETTPPPAPTSPDAPTAPAAPTTESSPTPDSTSTQESTGEKPPKPPKQTSDDTTAPSTQQTESTTPQTETQSNGGTSGGNVGDTEIKTGTATTTGIAATNANANTSASLAPSGGSSGSGISLLNNGNGSDSNNTGSATVASNNTTQQINSATAVSGGSLVATTGDNNSSKNVGNTTITTGNADATGTLITSVNTNIDGVMVSEFNIVDDHIGDYVLDFASNCIIGCLGGSATVKNSDNGSGSTNTGNLDLSSSDATFQTNDATVKSSLVMLADSGNNTGNKNTGGDTAITTGDANVAANALTFANNNIEGAVIFGVVNIYGDLIGDIVFPEEMLACCGGGVAAVNSGNGSNSTNTATVNSSTSDQTFQNNLAVIDNVLLLNATTGDNTTSKNTGGDNSIKTGSASIDAQVLNIANTNLEGTPMWLVIVNEAGRWIGRIFGAPEGSMFAGSAGSQFTVNESGEITVTNSDNGSGSTNTGTVNQTTNNTTVQTNTAHVVNTLDLTANTGDNSASNNTGGNSTIETGDATIIANVVNFVNNNITGGGKLFVTVVNVFGSWIGDFVTPGSHKEKLALAQSGVLNPPAIGGAPLTSANQDPQTSTLPNNPTSPESMPTSQSTTGTTSQTQAASMSQPISGSGQTTLTALVAGYTNAAGSDEDVARGTVAGRKVININLAWLLLLVPCAILWIVRKRFLHLVSLTLKFLPLRKSPAVS